MNKIQIHPNGTSILIDRAKGTIAKLYAGQETPFETYRLADFAEYCHCRTCGKPLDDDDAAFAFWKLEARNCSTECNATEHIKHFGCCEKATPTQCVCMYSFTCPEHGETHIGSHD